MVFTNFKDLKPKRGMVTWRTSIEGVEILFNAEMRIRGAGFEKVLSPEFDYWDGCKVHVKHNVSWSSELINIKDHTVKPLIKVNRCPICKKEPLIRHNRTTPMEAEYFYIECCSWINGMSNRDGDINRLILDWNTIGVDHEPTSK